MRKQFKKLGCKDFRIFRSFLHTIIHCTFETQRAVLLIPEILQHLIALIDIQKITVSPVINPRLRNLV